MGCASWEVLQVVPIVAQHMPEDRIPCSMVEVGLAFTAGGLISSSHSKDI